MRNRNRNAPVRPKNSEIRLQRVYSALYPFRCYILFWRLQTKRR